MPRRFLARTCRCRVPEADAQPATARNSANMTADTHEATSPRGGGRAASDDSAFEPLLSPKEPDAAKQHTFAEFLGVAWRSGMLSLMPMMLFYVSGVVSRRARARASHKRRACACLTSWPDARSAARLWAPAAVRQRTQHVAGI